MRPLRGGPVSRHRDDDNRLDLARAVGRGREILRYYVELLPGSPETGRLRSDVERGERMLRDGDLRFARDEADAIERSIRNRLANRADPDWAPGGIGARWQGDFRDVTPAEDTTGPGRRRRGRPAADPAGGAASEAERASLHRQRKESEVVTLVRCFRIAMQRLARLGDSEGIAAMFTGPDVEALMAVRRRDPEAARELAEMFEEARLWLLVFAGHWARVPKSGLGRHLRIGGDEFRLDAAGRVLRKGRPTGLRVNREHRCWVVADPSDPAFVPRRHTPELGGEVFALAEAALVVIEREHGKERANEIRHDLAWKVEPGGQGRDRSGRQKRPAPGGGV